MENDDYVAFAARVVAAAGRRVAGGDVEGLAGLLALTEDVERAVACAVAGLRAGGFSWTEIGDRLHITRQAAQQRWAHLVPGDPSPRGTTT